MVDLKRLYDDEAYAIKVLLGLIIKYGRCDSKIIENIKIIINSNSIIPGRVVGGFFVGSVMSLEDEKILQEIVNIYS